MNSRYEHHHIPQDPQTLADIVQHDPLKKVTPSFRNAHLHVAGNLSQADGSLCLSGRRSSRAGVADV